MSTEQASLGHHASSSTSDSRGSVPATSEGRDVPGLTTGKPSSPIEAVNDDRLTIPPGSRLGSSPGQTRASALSAEPEDPIVELQQRAIFDGIRYRRRIKDLEREVDDLKAEAMVSATQQPPVVVSAERISELQAKLLERDDKMLEKDNEIERLKNITERELVRVQVMEEILQQSRESLRLPGTSDGDKAGESSDGFSAVTSTVGESNEGSSTPGQDETGLGSHAEVENSGNRGVQGREVEEAREKRRIEQEKVWPPTQASGIIREVHKWRKIDEQGNRKVTAFDYQVNNLAKEDPARYTFKGKDLAPIESTTAPQIDIQEQAKPAKVDPFRELIEEFLAKTRPKAPARGEVISEYEEQAKIAAVSPFRQSGLAFEEGKTSAGKGPAAIDPTAPQMGSLEQAKVATSTSVHQPSVVDQMFSIGSGLTFGDLVAQQIANAPGLAPGLAPARGQVLSEYEKRGSSIGSPKAPLEAIKPGEEAPKPASTDKGLGTQEEKSAAKASPGMKALPSRKPDKTEGEQEGKVKMVPLGARNLTQSNSTAIEQPGGQQTSGVRPDQQQSTGTRGSGIARGGARGQITCYECGQSGHIKRKCPNRSS